MTGPALEVRDLAFAYPDGRQALFGCNLRVARGERLAILGPNGAGKTTLVLHLNGVLGGGEGEVVVGGLTVGRDTLKEIRRRVGIVFQDPDDQLFMPTVAQDVAFGPANMGLRGDELASRVKEALVAVGMDHHADRAPHHLSFGERRRVAIATVLAMDPEVLVLDEPSSNLDPAARAELADILESLDLTTRDGHPRPALRPAAVPPGRGDERRRHRGRRPDPRDPRRRRPDGGQPALAAVRVRPDERLVPRPETFAPCHAGQIARWTASSSSPQLGLRLPPASLPAGDLTRRGQDERPRTGH